MAQTAERLLYLFSLCEQLYSPKSVSESEQAQRILETSFPTFSDSTVADTTAPTFGIHTPTDTANALRILLENSPSPYVQMFALSRLRQLVLAQFTVFERETRIQLRTFLLEYAFVHYDLQPFVIHQLASVLALLTQFGYLEHEEYQQIYKDMTQFLQASAEHRIVGLQMLTVIVQDMSSTSVPKYAAKFRKAAAGVRDTQLYRIFKNAFELLESMIQHSITFSTEVQEDRTKEATLDLLLKCLSYDFAGSTFDESGEDTGSIQVPASWRPLIEQDGFVATFFKAYDQFPQARHAKGVLDCLVQVVVIRKGLFSGEEERNRFLSCVMEGIGEIVQSLRHMEEEGCYQAFGRLIQRFRAAAPLNDLADRPGFLAWIEGVARFTQHALRAGHCFHLLKFWAKVVEGMTFFQSLGETKVNTLQRITVELVKSFLAAQPGMLEEGEAMDEESFKMVGQIARCRYADSCTALLEAFEPVAAEYNAFLHQSHGLDEHMKETIRAYETKFAWFVQLMAVFIGHRPSYLSSDSCDAADGELITKVIYLMETNQSLIGNHPEFLSKPLDCALLSFFSQYRASYVGESHGKEVYRMPNEVFGIKDATDMLNLIVGKIIFNLQWWGDDALVIRQSLELLNALTSGYSALKMLKKIESITLLMQNHLANDFFRPSDKHRASRVLYYQILSKILFADDHAEEEFYAFMKPFEVRLDTLSLLSTRASFEQADVKQTIVDLFRDLRGLIEPIQSRRHFVLFFDWFYPDYMPILQRAIEAWAPDAWSVDLLKFFQVLVYNKSQRLNLDIASASGILLFRDASQILCSYGQRAIRQTVSEESKKYAVKYKGMATCFNLVARCLGGKYINFGVFWLYGDKAINEAFQMTFQMMLNIPLQDMMHFPKLTKAFFFWMDEFSNEQMMKDPEMPAEAFLYILEACELGVESNHSYIRTHACVTLNNLCTHVVQARERASIEKEREGGKKRREDPGVLLTYFYQFSQVLPKLLTSVFNMILFDDNNDYWQLSRPLYTLVLLEREFASDYTNQVILKQLPERREFVTKLLSHLMDGNGWTLNTKDREKFSQQISNLKRELVVQQITLAAV
ncbi:armadillo-type protein [Sporodiniella umbellata]|nr:armadillo-type protein [Sporodiniella umbellata]